MAGRDARFRLLTPAGEGGVAVVEVTGVDRDAALSALLQDPGGGPIRLVRVLAGDGAIIDQALRVEHPGAERLELHLHGSPGVLAAVERAVGGFAEEEAADPAELLLREAVHPNQLALALEQRACGGFPALCAGLRMLEGPDRDAAVVAARGRTLVARALAEPATCVLVGRQNAGKSTLLNRLAFRERALTGASPGLTRDPVREAVVLSGYPYRLVDTAGLGGAVDALDVQAQRRTLEALAEGVVLLVVDGSFPWGEVEEELVPRAALVVRTKSDLGRASWVVPGEVDCVEVSCTDPAGPLAVRAAVGEAVRQVRGLPDAPAGGVGGPAALTAAEQREFERLARGFQG